MYVTMMMTDQMLDLPPLLNGEVPVMHPLMNGDTSQQVIVVQVNPGETFTIRAEDGSLQCIQGPAEVPMMSPNGSIPPIHVPPGYISQVLEDNTTGVRRVVVTPHSECYPPSYSPALSPTHHMPPPYMAHPHFIPASHTAYYPPAGHGDVPPHQYYPHRLPHLYEEIIPNIHYNMTSYINREEPYCKPPPKKLKGPSERPGGLNRLNSSPPSSTYKNNNSGCSPTANGYKSHSGVCSTGGGGGSGGGGSPGNKRTDRRSRLSPKSHDGEHQHHQSPQHHHHHHQQQQQQQLQQQQPPQHDHNVESRRIQDILPGVDKPQISKVQSRSALVSWAPVTVSSGQGDSGTSSPSSSCSYELTLTDKGADGKYRQVYSGQELEHHLTDLRPATDYHVRVSAVCDTVRGPRSEVGAFTTHCGPPDTPLPPRLSHRSRSSLTLQWKPPVDNGSRITGYVLEWDEGRKNGAFRGCYYGNQRHFKVTRLSPATSFTFRLAALNDIGTSGFSPEVSFPTAGSQPHLPLAPQLLKAGSSWLTLEWTRPGGCGPEEPITYTLELKDDAQGLDFHVRYNGTDVSCTVDGLKRNTQYSLRLTACSAEWKIGPSPVLVCKTIPEQPEAPTSLSVRDISSHSVCAAWQPPQDDGGSGGLTYILEILEDETQEAPWVEMYSGPGLEHVCGDLRPTTSYSLRVHCLGAGGQSQHSPILSVRTLCLPPAQCQAPRIVGSVKHKEVNLEWDPPVCEGAGPAEQFTVEKCVVEGRVATEESQAESQEEEEQESQPPQQPQPPPESQWQAAEVVYRGQATECTVGSLLPGATYTFRVRATSNGGDGPYSESLTVITAAGPPGQCGKPTVTVTSHTSAVVSWESCDESSGADVTEYRLAWGRDPDALEMVYSGTDTFWHVSDLEAATEYCCRLQAANEDGAGPHSELVTCVTPAAAPSAVPGLSLVEHDPANADQYPPSTCLPLAWEEPCSNGADITSYSLVMGDQSLAVGNVTSYVLTGLQPNTEYSLQIQAENEMGPGPLCEPLVLRTRPLPPAPPHLECAAVGPQSLKLRWGESSSSSSNRVQDGEDILYTLQMEDKNQRFVAIYHGPSHTFRVQRLSESSQYSFRIQAVSEAGDGPFSDTLSLCTSKSVPPTLKAPRVSQLDGNACEVSWEAVPPMRGDRITYTLQVLGGRDTEYKQVFKGEDTCFQLFSMQWNVDYRFRVCANRHCADDASQELSGLFSPSAHFTPRRLEQALAIEASVAAPPAVKAFGLTSTDGQFATLIVVGLASLSFLLAFLLQLFLIE
ncbi:fibronectin type III domain-containing protein 3B [Engraulis encrasicolus]|uniref:fibronectin type III domain-containing protein 3B n=1 Tax=Engraulis encrasicolus TaxID=184585 RepID=UPI002FCFD509